MAKPYEGILVLAALIFSFSGTLIWCWRDKKVLIAARQKKQLNQNDNDEIVKDVEELGEGEVDDELDPREAFEYIIDLKCDYDYFKKYLKLMEKITEIRVDPRCDYNDVEKYEELLQEFIDNCGKYEYTRTVEFKTNNNSEIKLMNNKSCPSGSNREYNNE